MNTRRKKTHCKRGHEFTEENTYIDARSRRVCRACKLLWHHGHKAPLSGERKNQNTDKTHCIRGHELSGDNLVLKKTSAGETHRICRVCRNAEAKAAAKIAQDKYDALLKEDPIRWAAERRKRRAQQLKEIGWTIDLFEKRWEEQDGRCAICKKLLNLDVKHNGSKAHADHEHIEPPKPREILCGNCNLGIGNLKENPEIMRAAIAYVEKWKEPSGS